MKRWVRRLMTRRDGALDHTGNICVEDRCSRYVSQIARPISTARSYTGMRKVARKPPSGLVVSWMSPPCERAMSRVIARPSPVPASS
jgi:hypothetical protein